MTNSEYWKSRFEQLEAAQDEMGAASFSEIERQYRTAQKEIEGQIARWYQRLANNNAITLAEARKLLKGSALQEFQWDVQDYIRYGKENALTKAWMKELENASAKYHISKMEALKIHTQQSLEAMFHQQLELVSSAMGKIYRSGYYHTAYELQKGFRIGWDIAGLNQSQVEKVLSKPWAVDGKNFSQRIWGNKQKLIQELHTELTQNILLGSDPQKAIDAIAKKMSTSKHNAGRLVMTEEAYFSSAAQKDCFHDLGVEQYEIVATLDSHTSDLCRSLDGKVFPMKDFQPGVTAPPFHVYCRTTTVPYFEENFGQIGERAARDEEGKTRYVSSDMTYQEWEEQFVQDGLHDAAQSDIIQLTEQEQWALNTYISSGSYKINAALRTGHTLCDEQKELMHALDAALNKIPIYQGIVYRSMDSSMIADLEDFWSRHSVGKKITYQAYTSCATKQYDDRMDLQIILKSKTGRDIRRYNLEECEILFSRNTSFIVVDRKGNTIWMEEV